MINWADQYKDLTTAAHRNSMWFETNVLNATRYGRKRENFTSGKIIIIHTKDNKLEGILEIRSLRIHFGCYCKKKKIN